MIRFIFNNFNDPENLFTQEIFIKTSYEFFTVQDLGIVFKMSSLHLQQMHNPVGKSDKERENYVTIL